MQVVPEDGERVEERRVAEVEVVVPLGKLELDAPLADHLGAQMRLLHLVAKLVRDADLRPARVQAARVDLDVGDLHPRGVESAPHELRH
jgi:hypothetical protein